MASDRKTVEIRTKDPRQRPLMRGRHEVRPDPRIVEVTHEELERLEADPLVVVEPEGSAAAREVKRMDEEEAERKRLRTQAQKATGKPREPEPDLVISPKSTKGKRSKS